MINIYKNLIINYINQKLTINDILEYASKNNIELSKAESIIIYNFIKRNYVNILNGDDSSIQELKKSLPEPLYNKIIELYLNYKSKLLF